MPKTEKHVPAAAARFTGVCEFVATGEGATDSRRFRMLARSDKPMEHWYWGNIAHDMDGMQHKDRIAVDYAHNDGEVIGYVDTFAVGKEGLILEGELVSLAAGDRADEVYQKGKAGIPWEASINFAGPMRVEEVDEDESAEVNGYELAGPAVIVREWHLRGVAICPYGADAMTQTQFNAQDTIPVTYERTDMDSKTDKTGKDFLDAFGAQGGVWFAEGKDFSECMKLHIAGIKADNAALTEKSAKLAADLDAAVKAQAEATAKTDALAKSNAELTAEVARLKAAIPAGEEKPLTGGDGSKVSAKSAFTRAARVGSK